MTPIIPDFQPIPFPAPLWLLKTLLVLGFFLHAIPMNAALMGGLFAVFYGAKGRQGDAHAARFSKTLAASLPIFLSFAITQGIVPLLFLQLVYGPLYYASSIVMAVPWIAVLGLLLIGYLFLYTYKLDWKRVAGGRAPWLLVAASLAFLTIAFFFTNNMTLMLSPEKWQGLMAAHPYGGALNLSEASLWPRLLHMVIGAAAITGLIVGCFGLFWAKRDADYGAWLIRQGAGTFFVITLIECVGGFWFLMALPREQMMAFMGGEQIGSIAFIASLALTFVALVGSAIAWRNGKAAPFKVAVFGGLLTMLTMSVMRHMLREYATAGFFRPQDVAVHIQWDLLIPFVILAVGMIAYLIWLARVAFSAYFSPVAPEA
ncbi:MAG: hypothetical protein IPK79_09405 [Vampirovibrionales bacterium]|nr:hypothetical protein [Vampirovibrionales bacterium]